METLNPKTIPPKTTKAETTHVLLHPERRIGADMARWRSLGGGEALARAAKNPAAVREEVRLADLRGLGGSGFPAWRKWDAVAAETPKPDKYLIVNGNEDEPGTFKDRMLLEETPFGIIIGFIFLYLLIVTFIPGISVSEQPLEHGKHLTTQVDIKPSRVRRDVSFAVKETSLHAWLFLPEKLSAPVPCIIMAQGLG